MQNKTITKQPWKWLELGLLGLMIISLPSIEAPKNIFLVFFVLVAFARQLLLLKPAKWQIWDSLFLALIVSALLSSIFAGITPGDEWKGFRALLTFSLLGWAISRADYSKQEVLCLLGCAIIGVIPPLIWGYCQYLWLHTKHDLQLHSVGHVNHSAIYLAIVFGASVGLSLSFWQTATIKIRALLVFLPLFLFAGLIIGDSRGAVGMAVVLTLTLILAISPKAKTKYIALSIMAITIASVFLLQASVIKKQEDLEKRGDILSQRDKVWNVSLEASHFYPVFGIGMDNWKLIKPDDIKKSVESRHQAYDPNQYYFAGHSHNLFLTTLVERGWVGLIVLVSFMLYWLFSLVKNFCKTRNNPLIAGLWASALSAWLVTFGIGAVNTTMHHEHGILAFLFLGLYLMYSRRSI